jgi:hypothetical protein
MATYAVARDFCKIFTEEMKGLYLLALLLTADQTTAERCFASALNECLRATGVFSDWARPWARRAIIQNAISIVHPAPERRKAAPPAIVPSGDTASLSSVAPLAAVARLSAFDRFVYVASVLEGYSDQDCKVLLECTRQDVVRARIRAMGRLASLADTSPLPVTPETSVAFARAS